MDYQLVKKPRILCLHGFRSSSAILKKELEIWPEFVLNMMDLVFLDAPFPAEGEPSGEGKFPPYYEWFESNEDHSEYRNFDECVAYIEDCMVRLGPFDGLLGLSQGALLAAALPGMQKHVVALTRIPKIKFVIIVSGGQLGGKEFSAPKVTENAFSSTIECPSLHFIDEKGLEIMLSFIQKIKRLL
ncbi:uncharacterized protein LOC132267148 isoform X2 [Cornus florida]|uniref:uncharacterized protein LOC132267148 isoform X2 n=1 Tax=Cornus florida TaxID=4283 RepID=UPI00289BCE1E|nr:uncharacterized protein LOC132267148 isoform X2 [Cornus florida]